MFKQGRLQSNSFFKKIYKEDNGPIVLLVSIKRKKISAA